MCGKVAWQDVAQASNLCGGHAQTLPTQARCVCCDPAAASQETWPHAEGAPTSSGNKRFDPIDRGVFEKKMSGMLPQRPK